MKSCRLGQSRNKPHKLRRGTGNSYTRSYPHSECRFHWNRAGNGRSLRSQGFQQPRVDHHKKAGIKQGPASSEIHDKTSTNFNEERSGPKGVGGKLIQATPSLIFTVIRTCFAVITFALISVYIFSIKASIPRTPVSELSNPSLCTCFWTPLSLISPLNSNPVFTGISGDTPIKLNEKRIRLNAPVFPLPLSLTWGHREQTPKPPAGLYVCSTEVRTLNLPLPQNHRSTALELKRNAH